MKKVVIVTRRMIMGGIEKALISMLECIPKEKYDITVLVMSYGGELMGDLPKHVIVKNLYGEEKTTLEKVVKYTKQGKLFRAIKVGWYTYLAKRSKTVFDQEKYHSKMLPILDTEYDLAIAYHTPASFPVMYVINNLKSKNKVAWIHSDVSYYENELQPYRDFYEKFNKIFCVSKYSMNKFIEMFPQLEERTSVFYNILDKHKLELMSEMDEGFKDDFDGIRILTVGRLTSQKGQDIIPWIVKRLLLDSYKIRWYCIGDGEGRQELDYLIKKNKLEENFILLGNKNNPYPYIKQCDLYVQPSRHEGYCITLAEARAFKKPIVTTDFVGAREQIIDGKTGVIVNFDQEKIYEHIKCLLNNSNIIKKLEQNLTTNNIDNKTEINQLLNLV